jgi:hypothetical protein
MLLLMSVMMDLVHMKMIFLLDRNSCINTSLILYRLINYKLFIRTGKNNCLKQIKMIEKVTFQEIERCKNNFQ